VDDLGTVHPVDGGWEVRFERRYPHPVDAVWAAITDPAQTEAWWGRLDRVELRVGGPFVMTWLNEGGPTMTARITEVDPPRLLVMEGDVHGRLRFELRPDGDGTALTFTSTVPEPPDGEHLGMRIGWPEAQAGWHWHLAALGGADLDMAAWDVFRAAYLLPALHRAWNDRDAARFADRFADDGVSIGFDGSTVVGAGAVHDHLAAIFADHAPGRYVACAVDDARAVDGATLVRAAVRMTRPGGHEPESRLDCIQTLVVVDGRIAHLQNTPTGLV
jgi:uncharacterized protein (TIGR02246 family)